MKATRVFISTLFTEAAGFLGMLVLWGGLSLFYPVYIIPSPIDAISEISESLPVDLGHHLVITLLRIWAGFLIAFIPGTVFGILAALTGSSRQVNSAMVALQVVPGTILGVIFLIMFGIGSASPILLISAMVLPVLVINTTNGLSKRSHSLESYLCSIHATRWQMVKYSYLPGLVPVLQSNFSLGISTAIKVCILGEFIGSQDGLGYLLNHARIVFNMKEVFFYLLLLMFCSLVFQGTLSLLFSLPLRKFFLPEAV